MKRVKFMPINSKTKRQDVIDYAKKLEKAIAAYRGDYYEVGVERWFGIAYVGWGSWQEDVFFCQADTPQGAIALFEEEQERWGPLGEKGVGDPEDDHIFVYLINPEVAYRQIEQPSVWERV